MLDKVTITLILLSVILAVNLFTLKTIVEGGIVFPTHRPSPLPPKPRAPMPIAELRTVPVKKQEVIETVASPIVHVKKQEVIPTVRDEAK